MSGSTWRSAAGRQRHHEHGPAPEDQVPRAQRETGDSLAALQRLAGNEATRLAIQRLDDADEDSLLEAAKFVANPAWYIGSKAGKWTGEKIRELTGDDGGGGGAGDIAIDAPGLADSGGVDHDLGDEDDHVIGGSNAARSGPAGAGPSEEPAGGDPLVGLRPGDGLEVGTWRRRPRVKLLQYRLNEAAGAGLKVDGMWGKRTTAALEAFQLSRGIVPEPVVDAATSSALTAAPAGGAEIPAGQGGSSQSLPDISGQVAPDVLARWQSPLVVPPGSAVPAGSGAVPAAPGSGGGEAPPMGIANSLVGTAGGGAGRAAAGAFAPSGEIRTDPETLARFKRYEPVLYDMYYRYQRAASDTEAYFALLQQSAAAAGYWASRAFSSICASLAGIVLGPPGVALWTVANQFWGLGAKAAEEAERPILEAAIGPALDAIFAFNDVVQQSFNLAYPMQTPEMPWYVVGSGWIQGPTASLIHAYGQVQRLRRY